MAVVSKFRASAYRDPLAARTGPTERRAAHVGVPVAAGAAAMTCVGGSVAVSSILVDAPLLTAQAVRYAVAWLLLLGFARMGGHRILAPRGTEWLWLAGVAVAGLVVFNIALVHGAQHAEPAVLGVAVACVPLLLAGLGPLLQGRGPSPAVLAAALVVTCGAALVQGLGRSDAIGLAWAVVVLGGEAGFTLLAVPVLDRHGPRGVSVHTTWLAAAIFAVLGVLREGPTAVVHLRVQHLFATAYLAVAVTAVAFVLWYTSVDRLGASRAGLLTGIAPVAAAVAGIALGAPSPRPLVWVGVAVVTAGLALGLGSRAAAIPRDRPPHPQTWLDDLSSL
jgi:drug/metabolite transporter (DMT)-like permease